MLAYLHVDPTFFIMTRVAPLSPELKVLYVDSPGLLLDNPELFLPNRWQIEQGVGG